MKVVGVVGSARVGGNTELLLQEALSVCSEAGIETRLIRLSDKRIQDCRGCQHCKKTGECVQRDDVAAIFEELVQADAFILGSPVYFGSVSGRMKCLINRIGYLAGAKGRPFTRKVGGGVVVARRAGMTFALMELNHFFLHQGMIVPGSSYWNVALGREPGDVLADNEGMQIVRDFAANIVWLLQHLVKEGN